MKWLFAQTWQLLLLSFLAGALLTWWFFVRPRKKKVSTTEQIIRSGPADHEIDAGGGTLTGATAGGSGAGGSGAGGSGAVGSTAGSSGAGGSGATTTALLDRDRDADRPDLDADAALSADTTDLDTPAMGFAAPVLDDSGQAADSQAEPTVAGVVEPAVTDSHAEPTVAEVATPAAAGAVTEPAATGPAAANAAAEQAGDGDTATERAAGAAPASAVAEAFARPAVEVDNADGTTSLATDTAVGAVTGEADAAEQADTGAVGTRTAVTATGGVAAGRAGAGPPATEPAAAAPPATEPPTTEPPAAGPPTAEQPAAEKATEKAAEKATEPPDADDASAPHSAMQSLTPPPAVIVAGAANRSARTPAITESPYGPGSALPGPDGSAPSDEYRIKGNAGSMLYHTTASPYYGRTRAEAWFRTEEDARRAGFAPWNRKSKRGAKAAPSHEPGPYPGSAKPRSDGSAPADEFTVKGNEDSKLYHTKESPFYGVTTAEVWFRSEADAQRAGFTTWRTPR